LPRKVHIPENVREANMFELGNFDVNVPQHTEVYIVFLGSAGGFNPGWSLHAHAAGRAVNYTGPGGLEVQDNINHVGSISLADGRFVRFIVMIIHAVASSRHRWIKTENIIIHARQKAGRLLSAPTVLARGDVQLWQGDCKVSLHDAGIHSLLGDGVPANRQAVAGAQDRAFGLRRLRKVKTGEIWVIAWRTNGRLSQDWRAQRETHKGSKQGDFHKTLLGQPALNGNGNLFVRTVSGGQCLRPARPRRPRL
jgi:hypothetical protein